MAPEVEEERRPRRRSGDATASGGAACVKRLARAASLSFGSGRRPTALHQNHTHAIHEWKRHAEGLVDELLRRVPRSLIIRELAKTADPAHGRDVARRQDAGKDEVLPEQPRERSVPPHLDTLGEKERSHRVEDGVVQTTQRIIVKLRVTKQL